MPILLTLLIILGLYLLWRKHTFSGLVLVVYGIKLLWKFFNAAEQARSYGLAEIAVGLGWVADLTLGLFFVLVLGALFDFAFYFMHTRKGVVSRGFIWALFIILAVPFLLFIL